LSARDLLTCGQKWLTRFTPFFTDEERQRAACQEICTGLEYIRKY
jgi:hypothetical protein